MVEKRAGTRIKFLRSDGGEYFSNEFVREKADADAEATPKVEVESIKKSHERVSKVHRWRDESHDN